MKINTNPTLEVKSGNLQIVFLLFTVICVLAVFGGALLIGYEIDTGKSFFTSKPSSSTFYLEREIEAVRRTTQASLTDIINNIGSRHVSTNGASAVLQDTNFNIFSDPMDIGSSRLSDDYQINSVVKQFVKEHRYEPIVVGSFNSNGNYSTRKFEMDLSNYGSISDFKEVEEKFEKEIAEFLKNKK